MWVLLITALLIIGAAAWMAKRHRDVIAPVFRPSLRVWRVLRALLLLPIAWGLWISGRPSLQAIAVVIMMFFGVYLAVERPIKQALNEQSATDRV